MVTAFGDTNSSTQVEPCQGYLRRCGYYNADAFIVPPPTLIGRSEPKGSAWNWGGKTVDDRDSRWRSVKAQELTLGRSFGVTLDHGEDFLEGLADFCADNRVRQGFVPSFIAGFAEARIVGACDKLEDPDAPVWSAVHLTNLEAFGGGTFTYLDNGTFSPHIHVTVGEKARSAGASTSHLLSARVQFLTEMVVFEVLEPAMTRNRNLDLYDVPLLAFGRSQVP